MRFVNEKITSELELGTVREETREGFRAILARMRRDRGIEAVLPGCTELPLILRACLESPDGVHGDFKQALNSHMSPVPCLDTMELHIQALVDQILSETALPLPLDFAGRRAYNCSGQIPDTPASGRGGPPPPIKYTK